MLVASLGLGKTGASAQPVIAAPLGWTLATRTNQGTVATLAVYTHVFAAGETAYTWTSNVKIGGVAFVGAFSGVDTTSPVDVSAGQATTTRSSSISTPSTTTANAAELLIASTFAYRSNGGGTTWTAPAGMAELGDVSNGGSRSGTIDTAQQSAAGPTGGKSSTASLVQDYGIAMLTALRPASGTPDPGPGRVPGRGPGRRR